MLATGCDHKTARLRIAGEPESLGISLKKYFENSLYLLDDEGQRKFVDELKALKEKERQEKLAKEEAAANKSKYNREFCISKAMEAMGWTREEAETDVDRNHREFGITYKRYIRGKYYRLSPEDQKAEALNSFKRDEEGAAELASQRDHAMELTGWTQEKLMDDFHRVRDRIGCIWSEYYQFRFFDMTDEEQDRIFIKACSKKIRALYPRDPELVKTLESKENTNRKFSEFIIRPWCMNEDIDKEGFIDLFKDSPGVCYKPVFGLQARGVEVFRFSEITADEVYDIVSTRPRGVVEELVIQHHEMAKLNPTSVNCLRIVSVSSSEKPVSPDGRHVLILGVSLKIGGGGAIVDNLHAGGGVVCGVDLETGIVDTDGANWEGERYLTHPVTGTVLRGFRVPHFKEALAFVEEMCEKLDLRSMVGWDMAIGEDGPILIEANSSPDPTLLQLPYAMDKRGIKDQMLRCVF